MVYLGTHVDGFCGVSSVKEPQNYADPTKPKGCLIRCVTNEKSKQLLEAQGYQSIGRPGATPIPPSSPAFATAPPASLPTACTRTSGTW